MVNFGIGSAGQCVQPVNVHVHAGPERPLVDGLRYGGGGVGGRDVRRAQHRTVLPLRLVTAAPPAAQKYYDS